MEVRIWLSLITVFFCVSVVAGKDYYQILNIKRDATEKEIKRKFRELALKYHPDKNKDPKAEEQFREIAEAYDTLGNADKRRQYDMLGGHSSGNQDSYSHFTFNMHDFFKEFDEAAAKFHFQQHQAHHDAHQKAHFEAHQRAHQEAHRKAQSSFFNFDFGSLFDDMDHPDIGFDGADINSFGLNDAFGGFGNAFGGQDIHIHTSEFSERKGGQNCKTITRREGNTVSTITECQ